MSKTTLPTHKQAILDAFDFVGLFHEYIQAHGNIWNRVEFHVEDGEVTLYALGSNESLAGDGSTCFYEEQLAEDDSWLWADWAACTDDDEYIIENPEGVGDVTISETALRRLCLDNTDWYESTYYHWVDQLEKWLLGADIKSTAQKIAAQFGDDGQIFEDDNGQTLHDVCSEHGSTYVQHMPYRVLDKDGDPAGHVDGTFDEYYEFDDGSYIAVSGGGWDLSDDNGGSWTDSGFSCFPIDEDDPTPDYDYEERCERQVSRFLFWGSDDN
tara:strand:- start:1438 stop:2244 length:807 start_codon:yes stop_codon:yes gene_type:complete